MIVRFLTGLALLLVLQPAITIAALGQVEDEYQGTFERSKVFVVVEIFPGFMGQSIRAALAGDGRLAIAGAYFDTTKIRATVQPDTALSFINDLLAIDFLGLPEEYRALRAQARPTEDGDLSLVRTSTIDGGSFRITLHLGARTKSVTLRWPAYGAPEALVDWKRRFRALVKEHADWVNF